MEWFLDYASLIQVPQQQPRFGAGRASLEDCPYQGFKELMCRSSHKPRIPTTKL